MSFSGIDQAYSKEANNPAELAARSIFENRGNAPRLYRNSLVFLAADKSRVQDIEEAICKFLAWESILKESEELNLTQHQITQAKTQRQAADGVVHARLPEMYQWLIVPTQENPQAQITWQALKLSGADALADRASKKLKPDFLVSSLAPTILRMELDRVPLWRGGNHVAIRQLVEDFGRYLYLPRLRDGAVLLNAIRSGLSLLTWEKDSFAYADSFDEEAGRYRGLRHKRNHSGHGRMTEDCWSSRKLRACKLTVRQSPKYLLNRKTDQGEKADEKSADPKTPPSHDAEQKRPKRYHGTVKLDSNRVGRDAGRIADEIISHLVGLMGSNVSVTLEIEAKMPQGTPDHVVRTVTENGRTLKFQPNSGFESD